MLDSTSRMAVGGIAALCLVSAFVLLPARARDAYDFTIASNTVHVESPQRDPQTEPITIERDPFESARPTAAPVALALRPGTATLDGAPSVPGGDIGPLPSNLATTTIPTIPGEPADASRTRVTAIVTGMHPYAMLETAGDHVIKGIGDRVGGKPIVAIDLTGVSLAGGERLTVASGASTP